MKKTLITICTILFLLSPGFSLASSDKLPEGMAGQTKVEQYVTTTTGSGSGTSHSLLFDGNNRVNVTKTSIPNYNNLAVMAWIKPGNIAAFRGGGGIVRTVAYEGAVGSSDGWAMGFTVGNYSSNYSIRLGVTLGKGAINKLILCPTAINNLFDNNWHHVAFSWDGSNGRVDMYYDDQLIYSDSNTGVIAPLRPSNDQLSIAGSLTYGANGFLGNIDEMQYYSALPPNIAIRQNAIKDSGKIQNAENILGGSFILVNRYPFDVAKFPYTYAAGTTSNLGILTGTPSPSYEDNVVSQTTTTSLSGTYYGGFTGNEAVYNYTNETPDSNSGSGQMTGKKLAPSLVFNGSDGYVSAANPETLAFSAGTFSAWVKPSEGNGGSCEIIFALNSVKDASTDALSIGIGDGCSTELTDPLITVARNIRGDSYFRAGYEEGDNNKRKNMLFNDQWHQITVKIDTSGVKIYLDGTSLDVETKNHGDAPLNGFSGSPSAPYTTATMGTRFNDNEPYASFKGSIDDVRIYNKALSDDNIRNLYRGTFSDTADLKGHWDFVEREGTTTRDLSGNNLVGTLTGGVAWDEDGPVAVDMNKNYVTVANQAEMLALSAQVGTLCFRSDQNKYYILTALPASTLANWQITTNGTIKNEGYELFGYDKDTVVSCVAGIVLAKSPFRCFQTNSNNNNVRVMTSRTYVNNGTGDPVVEVASLFYPPKATLIGDAYLGNMDPDDFAFWGRNLVQSTSNTTNPDSFWGIGNYTMSPNAKLDTSTSGEYKARIDSLAGEAANADILKSSPMAGEWYLEASAINIFGSDSAKAYPQGKVWKVDGNLTIDNGVTFSGIGTVIVIGDLTIKSNHKISGVAESDTLGFIVEGNVTIGGNVTLDAPVLCLGEEGMTFSGDNTTLIGSFVAKDFKNLDNHSNIRFYYDKKLDSSWPPGFRYFKMPKAGEN